MPEYCPDNLDQYKAHEARQNRFADRLPRCAICDEPIHDGYLYLINDETICPACLKREFRKETGDFIE